MTIPPADAEVAERDPINRYNVTLASLAAELKQALAENARLRQERNEARAELADYRRMWIGEISRADAASAEVAVLRQERNEVRAELAEARESIAAMEWHASEPPEGDWVSADMYHAERARYTRLVGEVERMRSVVQAAQAWRDLWVGNVMRYAESVALAEAVEAYRALAATAPQTAPAQPGELPNPHGCRHCGRNERGHGRVWTAAEDIGWHAWVEPTNEQRLERMRQRRALSQPTPADPEPVRVTAGELALEVDDDLEVEFVEETRGELLAEIDGLRQQLSDANREIDRLRHAVDVLERTDPLPTPAHPAGDEHLQALRDERDEARRDRADYLHQWNLSAAALAEARREAERLRGEVERAYEIAHSYSHETGAAQVAERLRAALGAGSSDTTAGGGEQA